MIYVLRKVLFQSTDTFLVQNETQKLAEHIARELQMHMEKPGGKTIYENWYDIPWPEILAEALKIDFYASYMGTWIDQTADLLPLVFERGGIIRAFLPKPDSEAARRIVERIQKDSVRF